MHVGGYGRCIDALGGAVSAINSSGGEGELVVPYGVQPLQNAMHRKVQILFWLGDLMKIWKRWTIDWLPIMFLLP